MRYAIAHLIFTYLLLRNMSNGWTQELWMSAFSDYIAVLTKIKLIASFFICRLYSNSRILQITIHQPLIYRLDLAKEGKASNKQRNSWSTEGGTVRIRVVLMSWISKLQNPNYFFHSRRLFVLSVDRSMKIWRAKVKVPILLFMEWWMMTYVPTRFEIQ